MYGKREPRDERGWRKSGVDFQIFGRIKRSVKTLIPLLIKISLVTTYASLMEWVGLKNLPKYMTKHVDSPIQIFELKYLTYTYNFWFIWGVYTYIHVWNEVGNCLGFRLNQIRFNSGRFFDKYWGPIERNVFEYMIHEFEIETLLIFLNTFWNPKI